MCAQNKNAGERKKNPSWIIRLMRGDVNAKLIAAAKKGDSNVVTALLNKGADVNAKDEHGQTALICALTNGHAETTRVLIAQGADVNAKDETGTTTLIHAVSVANNEIVDDLLANGANVNAKDKSHQTALIHAVSIASNEIVSKLLAKGAGVNDRGKGGQSALIVAVTQGHAETVRVLVAQGADVNAKDRRGQKTALMHAAANGKAEIAETLIARGADVNAKDFEGRTTLIEAVANGWYRTVRILIAQGADVNAKDHHGVTPMIDAIYNAQPHMVELLRNAGAVIPYVKDIDKLEAYFESPAPDGDARCSNGKCPYATPGDTIRRGEGFLHISPGLVRTRSKARSMAEVESQEFKWKFKRDSFWEDEMRDMDNSGGPSLIEEAVFGTSHRTRHGLSDPTEDKSTIHPVLMCQKCAEKRDIVLDAAAQDAWFWWETGLVPLRTTLTNQELAARVENYGAQEALGEVCVVHVMLTMVVHPDDVLLTDPDNISRWSERILNDEQKKRKLAPDAKTGLIMARGVSVDKAINDLPEQMEKFMRSDGRDPCQYETESFTQDTNRDDVKYVCMIASAKKKQSC